MLGCRPQETIQDAVWLRRPAGSPLAGQSANEGKWGTPTPPQSLIAAMHLYLCLVVVVALLGCLQVCARPVELGDEGRLFPDDDNASFGYTAEAAADLVKHLPGAPPGHVKLFSG